MVVLILALLGSSCTPFDVSAPEDYIGPKSTEPNALAAEGHGVVESQPAVVEPPAQTGPLQITTEQAVLLALENNRSLVVERLNPRISRTFVSEELSVFDPILSGQLGYEWDQLTQGSTDVDQSGPLASVGVDEFLPTGTTFGVSGEVSPSEPGLFASTGDDYTSTLAFNATQSLLRGAGTAVNMASVNQAKIDVEISQYELRGFVQTLIAQVEETYWDYVLAERRIEIYSQSLDLAEKQLAETEERIKIGDLAKTESSAAEAEVALRREALINARSTLAKTKLSLLRLVNPPGTNLWDRQITLASLPTSLSVALDDVEPHVELAMRMRPDLNQAKLLWQRGDLEVVKTRNGLLPKLDLFVTLGRTGYSNSFGESATSSDDYGYGAMTGLSFEFPAGNRAARSSHLRAVLSRQQAKEAVGNLSQLIEVDVRTAYLEIVRSQEQVAATAVTRKFQEEKVRVEMEKFRLGKSTPLLVAQAQRDLVVSQIDETQAMVNYLKSFVEIYRLEGSLLERRGIAGPGQKPVEWSAEP
ncbi:MAG: TolC family protein [Solirubrobacterales bacterium]